jgi:hypothetical protein
MASERTLTQDQIPTESEANKIDSGQSEINVLKHLSPVTPLDLVETCSTGVKRKSVDVEYTNGGMDKDETSENEEEPPKKKRKIEKQTKRYMDEISAVLEYLQGAYHDHPKALKLLRNNMLVFRDEVAAVSTVSDISDSNEVESDKDDNPPEPSTQNNHDNNNNGHRHNGNEDA